MKIEYVEERIYYCNKMLKLHYHGELFNTFDYGEGVGYWKGKLSVYQEILTELTLKEKKKKQ